MLCQYRIRYNSKLLQMAASPLLMNSKKPVIFLWSLTVKCCINIVDSLIAVIFILPLLGPFTEAFSGKALESFEYIQ